MYSGSAVVNVNNTSGFFPNQDNGVVAIYTIAAYTTTAGVQTQNIAYSADGGYTFETYAGNPVIDINSTQFRDPKVLWHVPTEKWVMVVAYASEFTIGIYVRLENELQSLGFMGLTWYRPRQISNTGRTRRTSHITACSDYSMSVRTWWRCRYRARMTRSTCCRCLSIRERHWVAVFRSISRGHSTALISRLSMMQRASMILGKTTMPASSSTAFLVMKSRSR